MIVSLESTAAGSGRGGWPGVLMIPIWISGHVGDRGRSAGDRYLILDAATAASVFVFR